MDGSPLQSLKRSQVSPAAFRLLRHQDYFINLKGFDHWQPHLRVATCPQSMKMMDVSAFGCVQLMIIPALESLTLHTGKSLIGHSLFMHNNPTEKALAISVQGGASLTTLTFLRASLSVWCRACD